uniref:Uncharacterized protein n=1 Tax=Plectus sambesii TaxID=2011161 RepID=A0A914WDD1_9BILA
MVIETNGLLAFVAQALEIENVETTQGYLEWVMQANAMMMHKTTMLHREQVLSLLASPLRKHPQKHTNGYKSRHKHNNKHMCNIFLFLAKYLCKKVDEKDFKKDDKSKPLEWKDKVWQQAEKELITELTWQGMHGLALKIVPHLNDFSNNVLPLHVKKALQEGLKGQEAAPKRNTSVLHMKKVLQEGYNRKENAPKEVLLHLYYHNSSNDTMQSSSHLFACSVIGSLVASILLQRFIDTWNNHVIPGKRKPLDYVSTRQNYQIPPHALPSTEDAVLMYQSGIYGGSLTEETEFGENLLQGRPFEEQERDQRFWIELEASGGVTMLANTVINHSYQSFQDAVLRFIEITNSLL